MGAYCECRRKWDYSSMMRQGLQPSMLPRPLIQGQGIHVALDAGYKGCIGGPAIFDVEAAIHTYSVWLAGRMEQAIERTGPLWDDEKEMYEGMGELGMIMLKHYELWTKNPTMPLDRGYNVLGTEYLFKVPIPGTDLAYAGRIDGLIQDRNTGQVYILEFKTTRSLKYLPSVLRGMQSTAYLWAARQICEPQGIRVSGILYRALLKKKPGNPKVLQSGGFSRNKNQKSTVVWYKHCLDVMAKRSDIDSKELYHAAGNMLAILKGRENEFFQQVALTRGKEQIAQTLVALQELGREMANPRVVIFARSGFHCDKCSYRDPCDLVSRGFTEEAEALLDAEYARRDYWEGRNVQIIDKR